VEVQFNPWQLLWQRRLPLNVTLIKPNVYLEQDARGIWVSTQLRQTQEPSPIKVQLNQLRLQDAIVELLARPKPQRSRQVVRLHQVAGFINLLDDNRRFSYYVRADSETQGKFRLRGESQRFGQKDLLSKINLEADDLSVREIDRLIRLPVDIQSGRTTGKVDITLNPDLSYHLRGRTQLKQVNLRVPGAPQPIQAINGQIGFSDRSVRLNDVKAKFGQIPFVAKGTIDPQQGFDLVGQVTTVGIPSFFKTFGIIPPVPVVGAMGAQIRMVGSLQMPVLTGTVRNTQAVIVDKLAIGRASGKFRLNTQTGQLQLADLLVQPQVGGRITGQGVLQVKAPSTLKLDLQVAAVPGDAIAQIYAQPPPFRLGQIDAMVNLQGPVDNVVARANWQAPASDYPATGELVIAQNGQQIDLRRLSAQVYGGMLTGTGHLRDRRWQADVRLAGVRLARANADLRGTADGRLQLRGSVANIGLSQTQMTGAVWLSQGIALVTQPITARFNWDGRQINLLSATAPGFAATGKIFANVTGQPTLTGLDLQVQAQNLALSGLPLTLPVALQVEGMTDFRGQLKGAVDRPQIQGEIALRDLRINQVSFAPLTGQLALTPGQGLKLDTSGAQGRLALQLNAQNQPIALDIQRGDLKIVGQAQGSRFNLAMQAIPLSELNALGLPFPEVGGILSGNLTWNLARNELPQADLIVQQAAFGEFPTAFRSDQIRAQLRYVNGVARGTIALQQPRLGLFESDHITTNFVYANHVLRVPDLILAKGNSRFMLAGSVDLRSTPKVAGTLQVSQGRIEDVLGVLQIFELSDFTRGANLPLYATAVELGRLSVGVPTFSQASLKTQLERLAEVNMQIQQIANQRRTLTQPAADGLGTEIIRPKWADIRGQFDSNVRFQLGTQGLTIDDLNVHARNVEWRPYAGYVTLQPVGDRVALIQNENRVLQMQSLLVNASYQAGQLNLTRATAQLGEAQINLQLNYGGENTVGQLTIDKLPITEIQRFYPFSGNIVGELTTTATIGGSRANPSVRGRIAISEGAINGAPIPLARGFFGYSQGRLNVATRIQLETPEPLVITGDIPLPLPLIGETPSSDRIDAEINVKDEGLAFLNLFDAPVKWLGGEGQVSLKIGGNLSNITADGLVRLQNAHFDVQGLPEPLANVNGQIRFDRDQVKVEQLAGTFSRGNIEARGTIPLSRFAPNQAIPDGLTVQDCLSDATNQSLNVALNQIALKYAGLYEGGVRGCVNVAGNLFQPRLTGEIALFNGHILLGNASSQSGATSTTTAPTTGTGLEFANLRLKLDRNVQIVQAPIVNFTAQGTLTVNGNLMALKPTGTIFLQSGQVNLFTTQFVLARGYRHQAMFTALGGLDPNLDVRLIASVPEVVRSPVRTSEGFLPSEVNDTPLFATNLGALQTVRIEAKVVGPASQLFDNLELSSSPNRSRNEIIGLIGGSAVSSTGRGGGALGLANLAGSALLNNVQGFIGNAVGLSEFRLFPAVTTDKDERSSTLGFAAEAAVDITPTISASVLKVLTSSQPAQFGLRYRINDNLLFRGSTDFSGDDRAVLEYNANFSP
jgi:translocation and assembly module TamB